METIGNRKASRMIAAVAMAMCVGGATSAHANSYVGAVTISGTRYVDGVATKVKCSAAEGSLVDSSAFGARVFTVTHGFHCDLWYDSDDNDQLKFDGKENYIVKSGVTTETLAFSGVQTAAGPSGSDPAHGAANGILKCPAAVGCNSEKGFITYSRHVPGFDVIFIGTYKAHF